MRRALILIFTMYAAVAFAATNLNVSIREWDLPTPKSRPHDPAVGADGALWYTAQEANAIGRLDPTTGEIKQFPLKTAHSGPHGLVSDAAGNIWFTANYAGYIAERKARRSEGSEGSLDDSTRRRIRVSVDAAFLRAFRVNMFAAAALAAASAGAALWISPRKQKL